MTTEHIFKGTIAYPFLTKLNKYNKYALNFYPESKEDRQAIKATGTKCGVKEDKEGELFYTFTTEEHPKAELPVTNSDGEPISDLIGNGSTARVKFTVEKFTSPTYGETSRTRLAAVVIDNLLPYEKKEANPLAASSDASGEGKSSKMPF